MENFDKALVVSVNDGPDELVPIHGTRVYFGSSTSAAIGIEGEGVLPYHGYITVRRSGLFVASRKAETPVFEYPSRRLTHSFVVGNHKLAVRLAEPSEFDLPLRPRIAFRIPKAKEVVGVRELLAASGFRPDLRVERNADGLTLYAMGSQGELGSIRVWSVLMMMVAPVLFLGALALSGGESRDVWWWMLAGGVVGLGVVIAMLRSTSLLKHPWKTLLVRNTTTTAGYRSGLPTTRVKIDGEESEPMDLCLWLKQEESGCALYCRSGQRFNRLGSYPAGSTQRSFARALATELGVHLHENEQLRTWSPKALVALALFVACVWFAAQFNFALVPASTGVGLALVMAVFRGKAVPLCDHWAAEV